VGGCDREVGDRHTKRDGGRTEKGTAAPRRLMDGGIRF
jgi:hypothetical protein